VIPQSEATARARHPSSPLLFPAFRALWLAATFSNIGTFVQDVAQAWLMLEITKSALYVALLTVLYTLPFFFFAIPVGVLADRLDRRKMLLVGQLLAAVAALLLSLAERTGHATRGALLAASLGFGVASAINSSPWQSLQPELVPRRMMPEAIALNSVSFNIARVLGPALGGYLLGTLGAAFAFLVNGLSFLAVVLVLLFQKEIARVSREGKKPHTGEGGLTAILSAIRMVFLDEKVRACTLSVMGFSVTAAMTMAVLPVFAKQQLHVDARGYGSVLGALGLGAVIGASIMKRLRGKLGAGIYVSAMMSTFAVALLIVAWRGTLLTARLGFVVAGIGWVGTFSSLMALVQLHAPAHAKSRVVSVYGVSWLGVWIIAALVAGAIAKSYGATTVLYIAATWGLGAAILAWRFSLPEFEDDAHPRRASRVDPSQAAATPPREG